MMIHSITLIEKLPHLTKEGLIDMGKIYRVGFFTDFDEAKVAIKEGFTGDNDYCKTEFDRFKWCVVESIDEGIPALINRTVLYKWVNGKFVRITETPEEFNVFSNFCMG